VSKYASDKVVYIIIVLYFEGNTFTPFQGQPYLATTPKECEGVCGRGRCSSILEAVEVKLNDII
jgi:hypothetical protein